MLKQLATYANVCAGCMASVQCNVQGKAQGEGGTQEQSTNMIVLINICYGDDNSPYNVVVVNVTSTVASSICGQQQGL